MKHLKIKIFAIAALIVLTNGIFLFLSGCSHNEKDGGALSDNGGEIFSECPHDFTGWEIVKRATCTESGVKSRSCIICGEREFISIASTGHEFCEFTPHEDADCKTEKNGTEGHYHCKKCGKNFDEDGVVLTSIEIPYKHDFEKWTEYRPMNCKSGENGVKGHYFCSVCEKYFDKNGVELDSVVIPARHDFTEWKEGFSSDCGSGTTGEKGRFECRNCGCCFDENFREISDIFIIPQHDFGKLCEGRSGDCLHRAIIPHKICIKCGGYYSESGEKLESVYGGYGEHVRGECVFKDDDTHEIRCIADGCGAIISSGAHRYEKKFKDPANSLETIEKCVDCGHEKTSVLRSEEIIKVVPEYYAYMRCDGFDVCKVPFIAVTNFGICPLIGARTECEYDFTDNSLSGIIQKVTVKARVYYDGKEFMTEFLYCDYKTAVKIIKSAIGYQIFYSDESDSDVGKDELVSLLSGEFKSVPYFVFIDGEDEYLLSPEEIISIILG